MSAFAVLATTFIQQFDSFAYSERSCLSKTIRLWYKSVSLDRKIDRDGFWDIDCSNNEEMSLWKTEVFGGGNYHQQFEREDVYDKGL